MKKFYIAFFLVYALSLPFQTYAAVDFTASDSSTEAEKIISIQVNSQTELLQEIEIPIQVSQGAIVSEVIQGDIECMTFNYTHSGDLAEGSDVTLNIYCKLPEAIAVDGVLAKINFTTEQDSYAFTIVEQDIKIGNAEVGTVLSLEPADKANLISTQTTEDVTTSTNTSILNFDFMQYLPYILLGGSVILLISIVGILLSKKKEDPKTTATTTDTPEPVKQEAPQEVAEVKVEPTLKDIVNEGLQSTPASVTTPATPADQEKDLQDLMALESQQQTTQPTMVENTQPPVVTETVQETPANTNPMNTSLSAPQTNFQIPDAQPAIADIEPTAEVTSSLENIMPETAPVIDLQSVVNQQIEEITTAPQPQAEPQPTTTETEDLPPVPPQM